MNLKIVIGCMLVVLAASQTIADTDVCPSRNKCLIRDCGDILENDPSAVSGDYLIQPHDRRPEFMVYCEMREDGRWTVIQRREDGSENFYRTWTEYKEGFGNVHSEFWLGNEHIHRITADGNFELLIELTDHLNVMKIARYSHFRVGSERSGYTMINSGYTGTAVDEMAYHSGQQFTTSNNDNDVDDTYS
ncbi:fibrinogen-like protein A [Antedon mediterranea]|uniref:fibrinogen-like protein A n=1 Tax=Antedon mediterranea TaxID=105859 RepID=UPI003AF6E872